MVSGMLYYLHRQQRDTAMLDYMLTHEGRHEVFDVYSGETIAECTTLALALRLIELHEGLQA